MAYRNSRSTGDSAVVNFAPTECDITVWQRNPTIPLAGINKYIVVKHCRQALSSSIVVKLSWAGTDF